MVWLLLHIDTMTKMYHSKNCWIWLKNKKVMAKFVPSATGHLGDIEKYTQFSNCLIMLNLRENLFFLYLVCCQYCWEYLEVTMIRICDLDFFRTSSCKKCDRRQRDVGNGTCKMGCYNGWNIHFREKCLKQKLFLSLRSTKWAIVIFALPVCTITRWCA